MHWAPIELCNNVCAYIMIPFCMQSTFDERQPEIKEAIASNVDIFSAMRYPIISNIEAETKWLPFHRWHFPAYFHSNFTEICSQMYRRQKPALIHIKAWGQTRHFCTNDVLFWWHIYATLNLNELTAFYIWPANTILGTIWEVSLNARIVLRWDKGWFTHTHSVSFVKLSHDTNI